MNMSRRYAAVAGLVTFIAMELGCQTIQPVHAPRTQMTVGEARKSMEQSLHATLGCTSVREVQITRKRLKFKADYIYGTSEFAFNVSFMDIRNVRLRDTCVESDGKQVLYVSDKYRWVTAFNTTKDALTFADALLTLKNAAQAPDTDEVDFPAFSAAAKTWLAAEPKPPMSDDARSSKAMAEDAFKKKDFAAALDAYVEALGKHPMWPEGHYNAALLAGEVEDYEVAARHMRRYLALAPDAKDASAAKDKLLLWQRKAKE